MSDDPVDPSGSTEQFRAFVQGDAEAAESGRTARAKTVTILAIVILLGAVLAYLLVG